MTQRWSAIYCATGAWAGKPIGRVRVKGGLIPCVHVKVQWQWSARGLLKSIKKLAYFIEPVPTYNFYIETFRYFVGVIKYFAVKNVKILAKFWLDLTNCELLPFVIFKTETFNPWGDSGLGRRFEFSKAALALGTPVISSCSKNNGTKLAPSHFQNIQNIDKNTPSL